MDSVATARFDLCQDLQVRFDSPKLKKAKLVMEGRVIGLLRSHCKGGGSAEEGPGCAAVAGTEQAVLTLCVPPHSVAGGENLSLNDHEGPLAAPIRQGSARPSGLAASSVMRMLPLRTKKPDTASTKTSGA